MESGLRFHDPVEMRKVMETYQRRSINKPNCLADYIPGLSLPREKLSSTRQKQRIYHCGHRNSPLATGCCEPRTNLSGCFLNQMEKPVAMVLASALFDDHDRG